MLDVLKTNHGKTTDKTPVKCPNCGNEKDFNFIVDKFENGIEIPRIYCIGCKKTFRITIYEEV